MIAYIKQLLSKNGGSVTAQIWFLGDSDSGEPTVSDVIAVDEVGFVRMTRGKIIATPWHQVEALNFTDIDQK